MNDVDYKKLIDDDAVARFNLFKIIVEKSGFFLGFCDYDDTTHLVLCLADPARKHKQMIAFVFPYMLKNSLMQYSMSPRGIHKMEIRQTTETVVMWMTVEGALEHFSYAIKHFKVLACPL